MAPSTRLGAEGLRHLGVQDVGDGVDRIHVVCWVMGAVQQFANCCEPMKVGYNYCFIWAYLIQKGTLPEYGGYCNAINKA